MGLLQTGVGCVSNCVKIFLVVDLLIVHEQTLGVHRLASKGMINVLSLSFGISR